MTEKVTNLIQILPGKIVLEKRKQKNKNRNKQTERIDHLMKFSSESIMLSIAKEYYWKGDQLYLDTSG